jgi:hypothetical protein
MNKLSSSAGKGFASSFMEMVSQVGIIHTPLEGLANKMSVNFCPKENTLTIRELSEKASAAKFKCKKTVNLPILGSVSLLLKYRINNKEYVAINPEAAAVNRRYIPSSLNAAIDTLSQLPSGDSSLERRINDMSEHIQDIPRSESSLIVSGDQQVLISRSKTNTLRVDPVMFKHFGDHSKDQLKYLSNPNNIRLQFLSSFFDTEKGSASKTRFPYFFHKVGL